MRPQLDGISPSTRSSLIASLDPSSISQFSMSVGTVSVGPGGIEVNLARPLPGMASASGFFDTGIDRPISVSRVEVDLAITFSVSTQAQAKVASVGLDYIKSNTSIPPKPDRVYTFSADLLGRGVSGHGASHMAPASTSTVPISFFHSTAPPNGPLFSTQRFAVISRIDIYGEWWWGDA